MRKRFLPLADWMIGLIVALLAMIIINLPLWGGLIFHGEWSKPDVLLETSDEAFYLTRIREVADGHPWAGQPYLFERRDQRYPLGNLWEVVLATPMRLFNMQIKTVTTVADAVFPFFLVFIFWKAVSLILPDKRWRLLLVCILFLGFGMILWKRPISWQQTFILPLLYFWAYLHPARGALRLTAARGALIGLMTLSYPFHWTYCIAAEGLLTFTLLLKDPTWLSRLKRIAAVSLPMLFFALPWIFTVIENINNPEYLRTLERLGLVYRHFPAGPHLQLLLVGVGILTYATGRYVGDKKTASLLILLLGAGLIVLNQPLITGREAEFSNHYSKILVFPFWISLLWSLSRLSERYRLLFIIIPLIGLLFVGERTIRAEAIALTEYKMLRTDPAREETQQLVDALNTIPGEQVILAEDEFSRHDMTVYTAHYPFFTTSTHMYLIDDATLWKRAAVQQQLFSEYRIVERGLVGSSNLNRALHDQTICRFRRLLHLTGEDCRRDPQDYLPPEWFALQKARSSSDEMIDVLRDANVTYALMKNVPEWLQPYATTVRTVNDYKLLHLVFPAR